MVVAPPSIKDGVAYRWVNNANITDAPRWLLALLGEVAKPPPLPRDDDEIIDALLVAETMQYVPTELTWRERNKIGMAIFIATNGSKERERWLRVSTSVSSGSNLRSYVRPPRPRANWCRASPRLPWFARWSCRH